MICIDEPRADRTGGQIILAAHAIEVGKAQALPQDAGDLEIGGRLLRHAGAVLGPLTRYQRGRGRKAHIGGYLARKRLTRRRAPLWPAASAVRPQSMNHKAEQTVPPVALTRMLRAPLSRLAEFGAPAQCQCVSRYRQRAWACFAFDTGNRHCAWRAALVMLGRKGGRLIREGSHCEGGQNPWTG